MSDDFLDNIKAGPGRAAADLAALRDGGLPIVLYGDGWYAPYLREYLARAGLSPAASFTDAGFTSSGASVTFDEIKRRFDRFNIVIAFANAALARKKLARLDCGRAAGVYFFDVMGPLLDNEFGLDYVESLAGRFNLVYGALGDELSRRTYAAFVNAKLSGDAGFLDGVWVKEQYFPRGIIELGGDEVLADCGAYTGDTMLTFARLTGGRYAKCYAFEPDPANAARLAATVARRGLRGVSVIAKGLWSAAGKRRFSVAEGMSVSALSETGGISVDVDTIDEAAPDATFIKMDVEGAELEALKGAAATIKKNRPKLAVCVYHRPEDLTEIPLFIRSLVPEYRLYLRQHQPITCETVLYAVV